MTVEPQSAPREARETIQALASPLSLRWQAQSPALPDLRSTSHVVTKSVAETYAPSAHNSVASAVRRADKRAMSKYLRLVRPRAARTETEGTNSHKSSSPYGRARREQSKEIDVTPTLFLPQTCSPQVYCFPPLFPLQRALHRSEHTNPAQPQLPPPGTNQSHPSRGCPVPAPYRARGGCRTHGRATCAPGSSS